MIVLVRSPGVGIHDFLLVQRSIDHPRSQQWHGLIDHVIKIGDPVLDEAALLVNQPPDLDGPGVQLDARSMALLDQRGFAPADPPGDG